MKKSKLSEITDGILLFAVTAFFGCAVIGFFSRNTTVIISAALVSALCITAFVRTLKKRRKPDIDKDEYDDSWLQFFARGDAFCFDAVYVALSKRYCPQKRDGYILCNKTAVYLHFKPEPLTLSRLFELYAHVDKSAGVRRIVVLTACGMVAGGNKTAALLTAPTVSILSGEDVFRLLRALNALPERTVFLKKNETGWRQFALKAISPKTTKRYLLTALFLIGSSFLFPMPIYYIVGGSVCLVLSILAQTNLAAKMKRNP